MGVMAGLSLAATLKGGASRPAPRRAEGRGAVATVTTGVQAEAAAFAASRTAPATAPATLSLKTLGMM